MKRFIPTLILLVLCIGGFVYAKSNSFFKEKDPEGDKQLVTVQAADVQGISITGTAGTIELSKKDGAWAMSKPATYPTDKFAPDSWIGTFGGLKYDTKIVDKADDLAQYGLDKPSKQFQVTTKDGGVRQLLVGKKLPVAGSSYVKMDDSPAVYEMSDETFNALDKQPFDFIDKNPFTFQYDKIKSMSVEWKGDKWLLEKAEADKSVYDTKWKLGTKEISSAEGTPILDKLIYINTEQMVKPAAEVKTDAPELKLEIKQEDNGKETSTSYVGKVDQDNIWIVKQGGAWAYTIPVNIIQDLYDKGKTALTATPSPAPSTAPSASPAK